MISWIKTDNQGCSSFYHFLEEQEFIARKLITDDSIVSAISGNKTEEINKYISCRRIHFGKCVKLKTATMIGGSKEQSHKPILSN